MPIRFKLRGKEEEIATLYLAHQSTREIAAFFNVSRASIWYLLKRHGIPCRSLSEAAKSPAVYDPKVRQKLSEVGSGERHINWGKHLSIETRQKISESLSGEKSPFWRGGISFLPYPPTFNAELKAAIRERDAHTCRICGEKPVKGIHHIDYDKANTSPSNLIILCPPCHGKTNYRRAYWVEVLKNRRWPAAQEKETANESIP